MNTPKAKGTDTRSKNTHTENEICVHVQQSLYNLADLVSHLHQVRIVAFTSVSRSGRAALQGIDRDLSRLTERVARRALSLGCYVNCTARWVAAGSNLNAFPGDVSDPRALADCLQEDFEQLRSECQRFAAKARSAGDESTRSLFVEADTILGANIHVIQNVNVAPGADEN